MTQEEKQLLLRDLCARLPYGVICHTEEGDGHLCSINQTIFGTEYGVNINPLKRDYFSDSETEEQAIKPYLRPMSSMTEEERKEFDEVLKSCDNKVFACPARERRYIFFDAEQEDFMNSHHFDYRGLIPMGLALEATENMYKTE